MTEERTKYCPHCGAQIEYRYTVCPACGSPQPILDRMPAAPRRPRKNPWIALILSLLVTGVGQIYLGRIARGLVFLCGVLFISFALDGYLDYDQLLFLGAALSVISAIDAYRLAKKIGTSSGADQA